MGVDLKLDPKVLFVMVPEIPATMHGQWCKKEELFLYTNIFLFEFKYVCYRLFEHDIKLNERLVRIVIAN